MKPRVHIITLGVKDLDISEKFYCGLFGWEISKASGESIIFFKSPGVALALYPRKLLAEDANVGAQGIGFSGVTLAHNVEDKVSVASILGRVVMLGGKILKTAQDASWGGHSGYFADPDRHVWEVAWNPHFPFKPNGGIKLP